jgi:hypothetical protein
MSQEMSEQDKSSVFSAYHVNTPPDLHSHSTPNLSTTPSPSSRPPPSPSSLSSLPPFSFVLDWSTPTHVLYAADTQISAKNSLRTNQRKKGGKESYNKTINEDEGTQPILFFFFCYSRLLLPFLSSFLFFFFSFFSFSFQLFSLVTLFRPRARRSPRRRRRRSRRRRWRRRARRHKKEKSFQRSREADGSSTCFSTVQVTSKRIKIKI